MLIHKASNVYIHGEKFTLPLATYWTVLDSPECQVILTFDTVTFRSSFPLAQICLKLSFIAMTRYIYIYLSLSYKKRNFKVAQKALIISVKPTFYHSFRSSFNLKLCQSQYRPFDKSLFAGDEKLLKYGYHFRW